MTFSVPIFVIPIRGWVTTDRTTTYTAMKHKSFPAMGSADALSKWWNAAELALVKIEFCLVICLQFSVHRQATPNFIARTWRDDSPTYTMNCHINAAALQTPCTLKCGHCALIDHSVEEREAYSTHRVFGLNLTLFVFIISPSSCKISTSGNVCLLASLFVFQRWKFNWLYVSETNRNIAKCEHAT